MLTTSFANFTHSRKRRHPGKVPSFPHFFIPRKVGGEDDVNPSAPLTKPAVPPWTIDLHGFDG